VGHENADAQNDECTCYCRGHTPSPSLSPVKGVSRCTVKTIHNHERCCPAADEFEPQRLDCNIRNDPRIKERSRRAGPGRTTCARFYGHARGKRYPLRLMCVRATLAPRCSRFTIAQIGEMIGPSSLDTDNVTQALSSGGQPPPTRLPGLPAGNLRFQKDIKPIGPLLVSTSPRASHSTFVYHRRHGGQSQFAASVDLAPKNNRISVAIGYARDHIAEALTLENLAEAVGMSRRQFSRAFRAQTAPRPGVVERLRADMARGRIESTTEPIERIAEAVGFGDAENMRRAFIRIYGQPPIDQTRHSELGRRIACHNPR
jgi:AraC-like DNA-binding protein